MSNYTFYTTYYHYRYLHVTIFFFFFSSLHQFLYFVFPFTFSHVNIDLYSSPNIVRVIKSRRMRWAGHVARRGEQRGVYRVLVGKPEGKRPLGRPRRRWVDNISMNLQEVGCGYVDWVGLAQDRDGWRTLMSAVMNIRVP